ncbi:CMP-sialic acid transporter 2 [Diplonema papillatum]|nr:CMP-sialic acid transporter 2 [Diplonema papillatum]|eukprot:gene8874-13757_t
MALLGLDTAGKKTIFLSYMGLWSALRLLIYGSKRNGPDYNQTTLLVFVSLLKLMMAVGMFLKQDGGVEEMLRQCRGNGRLFARYFLPAASYVVYDNLTFVNLTLSDPVTYVILMQMRLAATGLFWTLTVGRELNRNQWIAIVLLTFACMLQKGGSSMLGFLQGSANALSLSSSTMMSLYLIALQIMCGVFSSVFNEVLLKEKGSSSINVQNIFMYTHSLVLNVVWLAVAPDSMRKETLWHALEWEQVRVMLHPWLLPIVLILAAIGVVTSIFIKHLDSVRKTIASAIEIFVDAILSFLLFGIRIGPETVLATTLAAVGVLLFSRPCKKELQSEDDVESGVKRINNPKIFSMSDLLTGRSKN